MVKFATMYEDMEEGTKEIPAIAATVALAVTSAPANAESCTASGIVPATSPSLASETSASSYQSSGDSDLAPNDRAHDGVSVVISWRKERQKYILGAAGLLIGSAAAATVWASPGSNGSAENGIDEISPVGLGRSSPPSQALALIPTFQPSSRHDARSPVLFSRPAPLPPRSSAPSASLRAFASSSLGKAAPLNSLFLSYTPITCADTPGYSDIYGGGCEYYEAEANYPRACHRFGKEGAKGKTPNENCCACKALQQPKKPTWQHASRSSQHPTLSPTDGVMVLDHRPCVDTLGFRDLYGDGCEYYEADANYPQACHHFGTNGTIGNTPNENCCACNALQPTKSALPPHPTLPKKPPHPTSPDDDPTTSLTSKTIATKLMANHGASFDNFGYSIGIYEDIVIVGALNDDDNGSDSGSVYIFERDGEGNWPQRAKIAAFDGAASRHFGNSVGIHGKTAVVGAHGDDGFSGSAYVIVSDSEGNWLRQAKLVADDRAPGDRFGCSVGIYGDVVVVGAHGDDEDRGSAYVFAKDAANNWTQQAKLVAADGTVSDAFGYSVAVHGDTVAVGARKLIRFEYDDDDDEKISKGGSAHIFVKDGSGRWLRQAELAAGAKADGFGRSVGIYGDTVIVGASKDDDHEGSAYVYRRDVANAWSRQAKLVAEDRSTIDDFGCSVAIYGDAAVVGACRDVYEGVSGGSVHLFIRDETNDWSQQTKFAPDDGSAEDYFGYSVGIYGDTVIASSHCDDDNGRNSGSAYVFLP